MNQQRRYSFIDQVLIGLDRARQTASAQAPTPSRPSPAADLDDVDLDPEQARHVAGLMRINHTGEVCAQALYQGQAMTAKLGEVRAKMEHAADEEVDHLAWCEARLQELDSETSRLNPLFYGLSFSVGALAGAIGDRVSLGFVAATEEQVCTHLREHLEALPEQDQRSRAILEQMIEDEERHGAQALEAGGVEFPAPVKSLMTLMSKVMTSTTYRV